LSAVFAKQGHEVTLAPDGLSVLLHLLRSRCDLVIVADSMAPSVAMAFVRELRGRGHRMPVALFSAARYPIPASERDQLDPVRVIAAPLEERVLRVVFSYARNAR